MFQLPNSKPGTDISDELWPEAKVVMYITFAFTPAERKYHTTEREVLSALRSLEEVRWLIQGSKYPVKLYTDHYALLKVFNSDDDSCGRIARWQLRFGEFRVDVKHILDKELIIADRLSRINPNYAYQVLDEDEQSRSPDLVSTDQIHEDKQLSRAMKDQESTSGFVQ